MLPGWLCRVASNMLPRRSRRRRRLVQLARWASWRFGRLRVSGVGRRVSGIRGGNSDGCRLLWHSVRAATRQTTVVGWLQSPHLLSCQVSRCPAASKAIFDSDVSERSFRFSFRMHQDALSIPGFCIPRHARPGRRKNSPRPKDQRSSTGSRLAGSRDGYGNG